jgi:hypothetical protein
MNNNLYETLKSSQEAQFCTPFAPRLRAHLIVEHRPGCAWITSLANENCDCGATIRETAENEDFINRARWLLRHQPSADPRRGRR